MNSTPSSTTSTTTAQPVTTTAVNFNLTVHDGNPSAHPPTHLEGYKIAEFAVPMAVTVVVVIVLCAVVAYTKARKRRLRQMAQQQQGAGVQSTGGTTIVSNLPNTSSGVAMCGAAYAHPRPAVVVLGPVMPEMPPQPPAYCASHVVPYDQPPSYEDSVREAAGTVNVAFQSSSENLSVSANSVESNIETTQQHQQQQQQQQQQSESHKTDEEDVEVSVNSESDKVSDSVEIAMPNNADRTDSANRMERANRAENVETHLNENANSVDRTDNSNVTANIEIRDDSTNAFENVDRL